MILSRLYVYYGTIKVTPTRSYSKGIICTSFSKFYSFLDIFAVPTLNNAYTYS